MQTFFLQHFLQFKKFICAGLVALLMCLFFIAGAYLEKNETLCDTFLCQRAGNHC